MQVLKGFCRVEKRARGLERVQTLCLKGKIYLSASSRKLKWLLDVNVQLIDDYLRLKQTWVLEIGNKEMLMCPL